MSIYELPIWLDPRAHQLPPLPILVGQRQPLIKKSYSLYFFMWIVHANWSRENRPPPGRWAAEPLLCYLKFCCYHTRRPFVSSYTILPTSISFSLFIYFQFHHLPHLFPPMFIMCLAVCVLLLIISLLSFRLCILTSITTFRSIACFGSRLVRLAPESKNPATPTSSQSFSYYIVAIVDLLSVCFVLCCLPWPWRVHGCIPGVVDIPRASTLYIIKDLAGDCVVGCVGTGCANCGETI